MSDDAIGLGRLSESAFDLAMLHVIRDMRRIVLESLTTPLPSSKSAEEVAASVCRRAQQVAVMHLQRLLPGWGMRGRDPDLRRDCTFRGRSLEIVINPVDATDYFIQLLADPARPEGGDLHAILTVLADGHVIGGYMIGIFDQGVVWVRPHTGVLRAAIDGYVGSTTRTSVRVATPGGLAVSAPGGVAQAAFRLLLAQHAPLDNVFTDVVGYSGGTASRLLQVADGYLAGVLRHPAQDATAEDGLLGIFCFASGLRVLEVRPDGLYEVELFAPHRKEVGVMFDLLYVRDDLLPTLTATGLRVTPLNR